MGSSFVHACVKACLFANLFTVQLQHYLKLEYDLNLKYPARAGDSPPVSSSELCVRARFENENQMNYREDMS